MKLVLCGLWHVHAEDCYKIALKHEGVEVIGVYDNCPTRLSAFVEKYGTPAMTMEEMLTCGADGAIVCTSTDSHTDVICALAEAGMNIFTEKVLALTSAECERIAAAVEKNGVKFVISLPHKYIGAWRTVKAVVDSGELGKINYVRYRNVHSGSVNNWLPAHFYNAKECGGGAMIDLGAHGMYMIDWLVGQPVSAKSTFTLSCSNGETAKKNTDRVEDNAVTVMQYENGCIAINETGFVSNGYPIILEVGGEFGRVSMSCGRVEKTIGNEAPVEVAQEEGLPSPIDQFCTGKILPGCGIEEAKRLTRMMELAYGT
jgi:predicted dehydrogenase